MPKRNGSASESREDGFYEDDEPVRDVITAYESGRKCRTRGRHAVPKYVRWHDHPVIWWDWFACKFRWHRACAADLLRRSLRGLRELWFDVIECRPVYWTESVPVGWWRSRRARERP